MKDKNLLYIIDDDQEFLDTIVDLISEDFECEIQTFSGCGDAIKCIDKGAVPSLILSDIYMVTGSGLAMIRLLAERNLDMPLFYVTGMVDNLPNSDGLVIFRKPVDWTALFEKMKEFVR